MIRTLRSKFIFFAMAAVTVLLIVLGLSINGLAWFIFERQADRMMDTLVNSDGTFMRQGPPPDGWAPLPPPERDMMRSARFFTVRLDPYGSVIAANVDQIFYVDVDEAFDFAEKAVSSGKSSGRIDRYRYRVKTSDDGEDVFFLDMTREYLTMRTLFFVSAVIAAGSWLIVLLFVILLSGRVVTPIIVGMEKQKQFITNAGHELKTPLAIIQSNNDAMSLIHGENKYNRNIRSQVTRLSDLTSNLLTQARLDEEAELVREKVDISELAGEILKSYEEQANIRNVAIMSGITPDLVISTNREYFTQLLEILMDNASKYTPVGGTIRLDLYRESGHIFLSEENTCDQKPSEDPERLFDRFYRGDKARTQNDPGSGYGIGLSVARSICEALGGKLNTVYPEDDLIRFIAKF